MPSPDGNEDPPRNKDEESLEDKVRRLPKEEALKLLKQHYEGNSELSMRVLAADPDWIRLSYDLLIDQLDDHSENEESFVFGIDDSEFERKFLDALEEIRSQRLKGFHIPHNPFSDEFSNQVRNLPEDEALELIRRECPNCPYDLHRRMSGSLLWIKHIYEIITGNSLKW